MESGVRTRPVGGLNTISTTYNQDSLRQGSTQSGNETQNQNLLFVTPKGAQGALKPETIELFNKLLQKKLETQKPGQSLTEHYEELMATLVDIEKIAEDDSIKKDLEKTSFSSTFVIAHQFMDLLYSEAQACDFPDVDFDEVISALNDAGVEFDANILGHPSSEPLHRINQESDKKYVKQLQRCIEKLEQVIAPQLKT